MNYTAKQISVIELICNQYIIYKALQLRLGISYPNIIRNYRPVIS